MAWLLPVLLAAPRSAAPPGRGDDGPSARPRGALGYAGFASAMAGGRLLGARLVVALGERRLLAGGGLLAAVGGLLVVGGPSLEVALAGFVLVGLGLANVFPLAIARAGFIGGASGIALPTTVAGDRVRVPAPRPALARVGARLQPVVSGFGHGTGVYVRDLGMLRVDG